MLIGMSEKARAPVRWHGASDLMRGLGFRAVFFRVLLLDPQIQPTMRTNMLYSAYFRAKYHLVIGSFVAVSIVEFLAVVCLLLIGVSWGKQGVASRGLL